MDEVRQHVRSVREEQQPHDDEHAREDRGPSPREDESDGRSDERHPGEEEIPEQERVVMAARLVNPNGERPHREQGRRQQREHEERESPFHRPRVTVSRDRAARVNYVRPMKRFNLNSNEWDGTRDRDGWRISAALVGQRIGGELIGATMSEVEPGNKLWPYHTHY